MWMKKSIVLGVVFCLSIPAVANQPATDDLFYSAGLVPQKKENAPVADPQEDLLAHTLTLEECIKIALDNSPQAVAARLAVQEAHINVNLSRAEFLPTSSARASTSYNASKPASASHYSDHGSSDAYAEVELSLSGITDKVRGVKISKLALEQAELALANQTNAITRNVKKAYYSLLSAQRAVNIRTQSRDLYKEQYDRTSEYFRLGLRPKVDQTTAEVNLNNEELKLIRARNLVKTASAALANTMGVTTSRVLELQDIEEPEVFDMPFDKAVQLAYENRPDVLSSQAGVKISQIKLNQAKAGFFPTFSFSAGFNKFSSNNLELDNEEALLSASVQIPIFNAFKTYNNVKQARVSFEKTRNSSRSLVNDVFLEVQKAYIQMQESAESIPIAKLNVEKAKENLELAQGRYNEGIGDMIELKDAEVAYTDAELSLLTARYDYAAAIADLKQAMGTN